MRETLLVQYVSLTNFSWQALCKGQKNCMCALGALSADLIFSKVTMKEIGLYFLIHARPDNSTARAGAPKQGASWKMKHSHAVPIHSRFWSFGNC